MAEISSIDVKRNHIMVNLKITKPEFELVT